MKLMITLGCIFCTVVPAFASMLTVATYDRGIASYLGIAGVAVLAVVLLIIRKRKEK